LLIWLFAFNTGPNFPLHSLVRRCDNPFSTGSKISKNEFLAAHNWNNWFNKAKNDWRTANGVSSEGSKMSENDNLRGSQSDGTFCIRNTSVSS
jgi:hypothetical protein